MKFVGSTTNLGYSTNIFVMFVTFFIWIVFYVLGVGYLLVGIWPVSGADDKSLIFGVYSVTSLFC